MQICKGFKPWRVTWRRTMFLLHSSRHIDIISFNIAIRACEKGSQWQQALSLMSEARHRHLQVDVICYNAVMAACSEKTQWQVAVGLFQAGISKGLVTENIWLEYLQAIIGNIFCLHLTCESENSTCSPNILVIFSCL